MSITEDKTPTTIPDNVPVLAMYDVRGIQDYIFRTSNTDDVVGASVIVETIIEDALSTAIEAEPNAEILKDGLEWLEKNEEGKATRVKDYKKEDEDAAFQVLYIGGGNAYVTYSSKEMCIRINRRMSRYVIEKTYSLQLAVAFVEKTKNYKLDYARLVKKMDEVKAKMTISRPIAALPIMKVEESTGYAVSALSEYQNSTETELKRKRGQENTSKKNLTDLTNRRGRNSTLAVVHIDGNNMGLRIRALTKNSKSYFDAVNKMRTISYNIQSAYSSCFDEMVQRAQRVSKHNLIYKVLVAGDDITYICNGECALATVEDFAQRISKRTMDGSKNDKLAFSICAGIAYRAASGFPFAKVYNIAESCCESAKSVAKLECNKDSGKVGNWVDFQVITDIHEYDVQSLRDRDYITATGEVLTKRPYFIPVERSQKGSNFELLYRSDRSFPHLIEAICFFKFGPSKKRQGTCEKISKKDVVLLKNAYILGKDKVDQLLPDFEAKKYGMPDRQSGGLDNYKAYVADKSTGVSRLVARWYDALELVDLYNGFPTNTK